MMKEQRMLRVLFSTLLSVTLLLPVTGFAEVLVDSKGVGDLEVSEPGGDFSWLIWAKRTCCADVT
jgi:hypothetical protein